LDAFGLEGTESKHIMVPLSSLTASNRRVRAIVKISFRVQEKITGRKPSRASPLTSSMQGLSFFNRVEQVDGEAAAEISGQPEQFSFESDRTNCNGLLVIGTPLLAPVQLRRCGKRR
jgi:hypothetical protein